MSLALRSRFPLIYREFKRCAFTSARRCNSSIPKAPPQRSNLKRILISATCGAVAGGIYLYLGFGYKPDRTSPLLNPTIVSGSPTLKSLPSVEISRKIVVPQDSSGLEITLFQYPTCPFCCKVRAFLDYHGISYNVVEVNPVLRQQIKWSQYKKVPILLVKDGDEYIQLNDSSMIMSTLSTYLKNPKLSVTEVTQYYPTMTESDNLHKSDVPNKYYVMLASTNERQIDLAKNERIWRRWADEVLVHTLSPNVYRTTGEALEAFKWFSEVGEWDKLFSRWEQILVIYVGAYAMWLIGKKLKKRHNLYDDVRKSLYLECRYWLDEVDRRGKFAGGAYPNLADLSVFGILNSIEGCQAFKELLENTDLGPWYNSMKELCRNHSGAILPRQ